MPQPITHYLVCKNAMATCAGSLWERSSNFAGLGSFAPDLFFIREGGFNLEYRNGATEVHREASYDCYCVMLDYIKANKAKVSSQQYSNMKAFAYGFYSHVVTDSIFHPFIYRKSLDDWMRHPEKNYNQHKAIEAMIDNYIISNSNKEDPNFRFDPKVDCSSTENKAMLQKDVFYVFNEGFKKCYQGKFSKEFSAMFEKADQSNPIHESYSDYRKLMAVDFFFIGKIHFNLLNLSTILPIEQWTGEQLAIMNEEKEPWFNSVANAELSYSVRELFDKATKETRAVIIDSENFLADNKQNSSAYFKERSTVYLGMNYNLDTGLPSKFNTDINNQSEDPRIRFDYKTDIVLENLKNI